MWHHWFPMYPHLWIVIGQLWCRQTFWSVCIMGVCAHHYVWMEWTTCLLNSKPKKSQFWDYSMCTYIKCVFGWGLSLYDHGCFFNLLTSLSLSVCLFMCAVLWLKRFRRVWRCRVFYLLLVSKVMERNINPSISGPMAAVDVHLGESTALTEYASAILRREIALPPPNACRAWGLWLADGRFYRCVCAFEGNKEKM